MENLRRLAYEHLRERPTPTAASQHIDRQIAKNREMLDNLYDESPRVPGAFGSSGLDSASAGPNTGI